MIIIRYPALLLSMLLQLAPVASVVPAGSVLAASPIAIVLKWFTAIVALGGAVHATSPQNATVVAGQSVTFTAAATGTAPLAYQWRHDDVDLPGQTAPTLTLAAVTSADVGVYQVVISNAAGTVSSAVATLTVTAKAPTTSPKLTDWRIGSGGIAVNFLPETGIIYHVETSDSPVGPWRSVQTFGPSDQTGPASVTLALNGAPLLFIRLRAGP